MAQLNDIQKEALIDQGFSGALPEMMIDWAQHNGATSNQYNKAIIEALQANGATSSQSNTAWKEFLAIQGITGALPEGIKEFFGRDSGRVVLLEDSFTDTDGVLLENHVISDINLGSYSWTKENLKSRYITSNKNALTGLVDPDGKQNDYSVEMGETGLTIEAKSQSLSTGSPHIMTLIVRFVDIDNYVGVRWQLFDPVTESIEIVESVAGAVTPLSAVLPAVLPPTYGRTEQTMKIRDDGETITAFFADIPAVSYNTTRFNTATKVGLKNTFDPLATWDDVIVSRT